MVVPLYLRVFQFDWIFRENIEFLKDIKLINLELNDEYKKQVYKCRNKYTNLMIGHIKNRIFFVINEQTKFILDPLVTIL